MQKPRFSTGSVIVLALAVGMAILSPLPLAAQSFYGSIVGTVTDTSSAIVPGATVTVTNKSTNEKHTATSNAAGEYTFVDLVPATYSVQVERANFKRYIRDTVTVEVNTTSRVDAALQVGAVSETVEVSTETALLQTDSGTVSTKVEGQQVQEMPLNGRNVMNLLELAPGVIPNNSLESGSVMNSGGGTSTNPLGFNAFTINGGDNMEYLDGAPLNVLDGNNISVIPTQDSVQEFSVDTSVSGPDTGRVTGGSINFTSRSGTNTWHGSAYEYFRNADLNANTYFGNLAGAQRPQWNQNQYGLTIGLPIKKDKIFFFGSWEATHLLTGIATSTNLPTAAMQAGTFTRQITDPRAPGDGCVITQATVPTTTYQLGPGCLDPTAQVLKTIWSALPNQPNNTADNYFINIGAGDNENQLNVRMDFDISPRQRLFVHDVWWNPHDKPLVPFPNPIANPIVQWNYKQAAGAFNTNLHILGYTLTVSPKTVVDLRAMNLREYYAMAGENNSFDLTPLGSNWAALNASVPAGHHFIPSTSLSGSGAVHNLYAIGTTTDGYSQFWDTYSINGSVTHLAGKHSLKIGFEDRLLDYNVGIQGFAVGNSTFGINFTQGNGACPTTAGCGDEWAELLMGYFQTVNFGTGGNGNGSGGGSNYSYYQGYYVQDTWQAAHKLTLNLGLRWELPGGLAEKANRTTVLLPYTVDPNTLAYGTQTLVASTAYPGRSVVAENHHLFDPRVGFAYRLDNKTVIRGGYGITNESIDLDNGGSGPAGSVIDGATSTSTNTTGTPIVTPTQFLKNPFPQGIVAPSYRSNPAFNETLMQNSQTSGGFAMSGYYPYAKYPYIQEWNFTLQRQIKNSFQVSVGYVGTHGVQLKAGGNIDEIPASAYIVTTTGTAAAGATGNMVPTQTAAAATGTYIGTSLASKVPASGGNAAGTYCTANNTVCNTNWLVGRTLQPYPYYKGVSISNLTYGNSHYNALQVTTQWRPRGGGSIGGALTWAKTIGDTGGNQDINNHRGDRTVSGTPSRLAINYVYPLPIGEGQKFLNVSGIAGKFVSGWALNGLTSIQHGPYLAIGNNSSNQLNKNFGAGATRASYVPSGATVIGGATINCNSQKTKSGSAVSRLSQWFNTGCFQYPGDYTFGNETANDPNLFGQGVDNWDIAMLKTTKMTEKATIQFRMETFNTFNRVQFSPPNTSVGNANYGKVTAAANNPRLVQLSLRISY